MNPQNTPKKQLSFGQTFSQLERLTEELESETIDLDEAIAKFERGLQLAQQLKAKLRSVEQRVEKIRERFDAAELPADDEPAEGAER